MKITVMGALIVIGIVSLVGWIVFAIGQGNGQTGIKQNEQPINPS